MDKALRWMTAQRPVWETALAEKFGEGTAVDLSVPGLSALQKSAYVEGECEKMLRAIYAVSGAMTRNVPDIQDAHNLGVAALTSCRDDVDRIGSWMSQASAERAEQLMLRGEKLEIMADRVTIKYDATGVTVLSREAFTGNAAGQTYVDVVEERLCAVARVRLSFLIEHAASIPHLIRTNRKLIDRPREDVKNHMMS
jgi:hypothetical protein